MDNAEVMKRSKNLFIFDGPIGRVTLLKIFLGIFAAIIIISFLGALISNFIPYHVFRILIIPFAGIPFLIIMYVILISYMKRLFHILEDKRKAIFYVITGYSALFLMHFIPALKIAGGILSLVVIIGMLTIPGKCK